MYQAALGHRFRTIGLTAVAEKSVFSFDVHFANLTSPELDLLIYGLMLEEGACHHIGYAKPFGLGSVSVKVTSVLIQAKAKEGQGPARYLEFQPDDADIWDSYDYTGYAGRVWDRGDRAAIARQQLLHILQWPRDDIFLYPDREKFFRASNERWKSLKQYQDEAVWVRTSTSTSAEGDAIRAALMRRLDIDLD